MAKLLIKCIKPYHSYIWPHAKVGDTRWGDEHLMGKLARDSGAGFFAIVAVEDNRGVLAKTGAAPPTEKLPVAPKRPRGRPRKNVAKE